MRVSTGIILSVLSSSVFAAVIPNYDSHGPLLVRRTGSPENKDFLWKRADEEQTGPVPSSSGAGANTESGSSRSEDSSSPSSENSGLSKMSRFRDFFRRFYMRLKLSWHSTKQRITWKRDERLLKKAVKKVAGVVQGGEAKQVLSEINDLLNLTQKTPQWVLDLYDTKTEIPFLLFIPKGKDQRSLTKAMLKMQNTAKKAVEEHLGDVDRGISRITKDPQYVMNELEGITKSVFRLYLALKNLHDGEYRDLVSKVGSTGNQKHIKDAETHISDTKKYYDITLDGFNYIKNHIKVGRITFKVRAT
ncbi:hypothetical protein BASA61_009153 [Batrachochytrium salamandrivorans]|nr:hypothetical protein BASA61_009153 [Batrachochytrium salamandrivorans]KAH9244242.1 hypothetical protein BASA81_018366 [Batrachochytrium salamandrivorans]